MMKTESGRSMVEMLGVLAIIGVLSIGGIAGYTTAMKKYKANEAAQKLAMASVLCLSNQVGSSDLKTTLDAEDYFATLACDNEGESSAVKFTLVSGANYADQLGAILNETVNGETTWTPVS